MDELRELYQETILDHHRKPRNFNELENATHSSEGFNPLCGDRITVYLMIDGETIEDIAFKGSGCAICTASASVMTESLKGRTLGEAEALFGRFHDLVTGDPTETADTTGLGKLAVFFGVREYPVRIKCATLAWHTLRAALDGKKESVSTE
jgi:nitrogen fixation NifU-like protein